MAALTNAVRSSAYQEKEINWAVAGGIASGFAGPIAGAAAAVDAMVKNAEIRAKNEINKQYFNKVADDATAQFSDAMKNSKNWLADIKKLYTKQAKTITWSLDGLFNQLNIFTVSIDVDSNTNAVKVQAGWSNKNKDAWIDCSIRGKLYTKQGKLAGCVYLNLQIGGTMSEGCDTVDLRLIGHCAESIIKEKEYNVLYEPVNLWRLVIASDKMQFGDGTTEEEHNNQVNEYKEKYLEELKKSS